MVPDLGASHRRRFTRAGARAGAGAARQRPPGHGQELPVHDTRATNRRLLEREDPPRPRGKRSIRSTTYIPSSAVHPRRARRARAADRLRERRQSAHRPGHHSRSRDGAARVDWRRALASHPAGARRKRAARDLRIGRRRRLRLVGRAVRRLAAGPDRGADSTGARSRLALGRVQPGVDADRHRAVWYRSRSAGVGRQAARRHQGPRRPARPPASRALADRRADGVLSLRALRRGSVRHDVAESVEPATGIRVGARPAAGHQPARREAADSRVGRTDRPDPWDARRRVGGVRHLGAVEREPVEMAGLCGPSPG